MVTLGYIFLVLLAVVVLFALVTLLISVPDIRRYLRIKSM